MEGVRARVAMKGIGLRMHDARFKGDVSRKAVAMARGMRKGAGTGRGAGARARSAEGDRT